MMMQTPSWIASSLGRAKGMVRGFCKLAAGSHMADQQWWVGKRGRSEVTDDPVPNPSALCTAYIPG